MGNWGQYAFSWNAITQRYEGRLEVGPIQDVDAFERAECDVEYVGSAPLWALVQVYGSLPGWIEISRANLAGAHPAGPVTSPQPSTGRNFGSENYLGRIVLT